MFIGTKRHWELETVEKGDRTVRVLGCAGREFNIVGLGSESLVVILSGAVGGVLWIDIWIVSI